MLGKKADIDTTVRSKVSRLRAARNLVAGLAVLLLVAAVVSVLVASNRSGDSCAAATGTTPEVPRGETHDVLLRTDGSRWAFLDFSGIRQFSGDPVPTGLDSSSPVHARATRVGEARPVDGSDETVMVDHVEVVLDDGTTLRFAPLGCL